MQRFGVQLRWLLVGLMAAIAATVFFPVFRETVTAVFGLIVGAATIVYALLTARLVRATEEMRSSQERLTVATADAVEAQTRPNVIVSMQTQLFILYLMVENAGSGEAFDVRFELEGDLDTFPEQMVTGARFIKEGFRYLAPRQSHGVMLANLTREPQGEASAVITVNYRSKDGRFYRGVFPLHLMDLRGLGLLDYHRPEERAVEFLERIQKSIDELGRIMRSSTVRQPRPRDAEG